jgi:hypothetical protein
MTIILIVVFVAALAFSLLFLLGARGRAIKAGAEKAPLAKPPLPGYFSGLISLYKWAFNYHVRPPAPADATVVSVEPGTRAATLLALPGADPPVPAPSQPNLPRDRPARPYGLQAIIDTMGDGIVFIFDGLINLFRWIFRIDR